MKEQRQLTGIRYWYGDDFIAIQNELIEAQESFYAPYGNCILKGCEVVGQEIAPGICVISGKIARFAGATGIVSFPVYLQLQEVVSKTRLYQSGGIKEIERDYSAVLSTNLPVGDYITINSIGGRTFRDAFQDTNNRMVTDTQINTWNSKEPAIETKLSGFNLAKSDAINSAVSTTLATSAAAKLAYDRGSQGITDAAAALAVANTKEPAITKNTGFNLAKSDAINSTASTTLATSAAVKLAYDMGWQGVTDASAAWDTAITKEPAITKNTGFNLAKSDAINSDVSTTLATSAAVKLAYDRGSQGITDAAAALAASYTKAESDAKYSLKSSSIFALSASTTLSATHSDAIVECTNSITVTLPNSMPVGMRVDFVNVGTGTIIFAASTTIVSKNNAKRLQGQYAGASAYHRGSNVWVLVGDLIV